MSDPTGWPSGNLTGRHRTRLPLLAIALFFVAVACSAPLSPTAARPGQRPQTGGPVPADSPDTGEPTQLDPTRGFVSGRPIYDGDFADPFVLVVDGTYYAYATNTRTANLPVIVSTGGDEGRYHGDAFPRLPTWSAPGYVWGPAVYAHGGRYILYYATRLRSAGRQCLSRAVSDSPVGPFVDDSTTPMFCQLPLGGSMDPSVVTDLDGASWLLFKNDGNCCDQATSIWSIRLAADGLSVEGDAHRLLSASQPWEADLIEAPSMVVDHRRLYLFYSANAWNSSQYAIGYAVCEHITGPCHKPDNAPWMTSTGPAQGPGGQEFFASLGQVWMVYHGWKPGEVGYPGNQRRLYLDSVRIVDGRPERVGAEAGAAVLLVVLACAGPVLVVGIAAALVLHTRARRRSLAGPDPGGPDAERTAETSQA